MRWLTLLVLLILVLPQGVVGQPQKIFETVGTVTDERVGQSIIGLEGFGFAYGAPGGLEGADPVGNVGNVMVYKTGSETPYATIFGSQVMSNFGYSIAHTGEFNSDGRPLLLIGAHEHVESPSVGAIFLCWAVDGVCDASNAEKVFLGNDYGPGLGRYVATISDLDGDNRREYLAWDGDKKVVLIFSQDYDFVTISSGITGYGSIFAEIGDYDGDGTSDLAIRGDGGSVEVYSGASLFEAKINSGPTGGALLATFTSALSNFGAAIAPAGDRNSDGFDDLWISAPGYFYETGSVGKVLLLPGGGGGTIDVGLGALAGQGGVALQAYEGGLQEEFGSVVLQANLNENPTPDLLVTAPFFSDINGNEGRVLVFADGTSQKIFVGFGGADDLIGRSAAVADLDGIAFKDILLGSSSKSLGSGETSVGFVSGYLIDLCPDSEEVVTGDSDGDGKLDCNDGCPFDANKIVAGICGCGLSDSDSDGDGIPDCVDLCPNDPGKTEPGECGCGVAEGDLSVDTDGDGIPDCLDQCPLDPLKSVPGVCGCGVRDIDSDGDGTSDCIDQCEYDPRKTEPGLCGCGVADDSTRDRDGDGVPDCQDICYNDPHKTDPGVCGCGVKEDLRDDDGDGIPNCLDPCPTDPALQPRCGCGIPDSACIEDKSYVTPVTKIVDPPGVVIKQPSSDKGEDTGTVRVELQPFDGAITRRQLRRLLIGLTAFTPSDQVQLDYYEDDVYQAQSLQKRRVSFDYRVVIRKSNERRRDVRRKITQRNRVTFRRVPPGDYQVSYTVRIKRDNKVVARTQLSPPRTFSIMRRA